MTSSPSFSLAPMVGNPDHHIANTNNDVAYVADVAADMLKEIVLQELDLIGDPNTPAEIKARATQRVVAMVSVVKSASQAVTHMAEAESVHSQVLSAPIEEFTESSPGVQDSQQERLAQFLSLQYDSVSGHLLDATSKMGQDPALADVLARRKDPGGVAGFFKRVSAAAVSLSALGARALALPGMVRQAISSGLDRADEAVQNSLDRWHAKFGRGVDMLRQDAAALVDITLDKASAAYKGLEGAAKGAAVWSGKQVQDIRDATGKVVDATSRFTNDKIVRPTVETVAAVQHTAAVAGATFMAVDKVLTQRLTTGLSKFLRETVSPAMENFVAEVRQEAASNSTPKQRTMLSTTSFQDAGNAVDVVISPASPKGP